MKKTSLYIALSAAAVFAASCKKDFLQKYPKTEISPDAYFNTAKDLETFANTFYDKDYSYDDTNSDNVSYYSSSGELDALLEGNIDPTTVGKTGWDDWKKLRTYNFLLDYAHRASGDTVGINHNIGVARFFRAKFYIAKLARYSDVTWYSHVMTNVDSALYLPRDPRAKVADSIMADLNYAISNLKPEDNGNRTRVNKWTALALMARFGLFEGTFRKYHSELGLTDKAAPFLNAAVDAAQQLIAGGKFKIYSTGKGAADYRALFSSPTLNGNPEIIQWFDCQQSLSVGNNSHTVLGWSWSVSNSLVESYLMTDGTPFTSQPGYKTKGFVDVFANRDPRLAETVAYPGYSITNDNRLYYAKPNLGGYDQLKFYPRDPALRQGWDANYTGMPMFRYAEVLLNLAEAKAELGSLTQQDVDNTINQLRDRVGMPKLIMGTANGAPDQVMANAYPEVSGANKGVILEIRRERRVELACEGLRLNDLNRWAAAGRIQDAQQGMYVPALGGIDMSGDGIPDIAILASPTDTAEMNTVPLSVRYTISRFYLKDASGKETNYYLDNGRSGRISFTRYRDNPRKFVAPKYFYRPISLQETVLNPNLKQIFGW